MCLTSNSKGRILQKQYTAEAAFTFSFVFIGAHTLKFFPLRAPPLLKDVCARFGKQWLSLNELCVELRQIHDIIFGLSC